MFSDYLCVLPYHNVSDGLTSSDYLRCSCLRHYSRSYHVWLWNLNSWKTDKFELEHGPRQRRTEVDLDWSWIEDCAAKSFCIVNWLLCSKSHESSPGEGMISYNYDYDFLLKMCIVCGKLLLRIKRKSFYPIGCWVTGSVTIVTFLTAPHLLNNIDIASFLAA